MGAGVALGQLRPRLGSGGGAACSRERPAGYRQVHDVREQVAAFREVGLLDERSAAIERFGRRARDDDDPYIQYTHHHVGSRGGAARLGAMYDALPPAIPMSCCSTTRSGGPVVCAAARAWSGSSRSTRSASSPQASIPPCCARRGCAGTRPIAGSSSPLPGCGSRPGTTRTSPGRSPPCSRRGGSRCPSGSGCATGNAGPGAPVAR